MAMDEAEIILEKEPGSHDNARNTIRSYNPEAVITAEHAQNMSIRLPRLSNLQEHSARLKKYTGSWGIRTASPVFFASPAGNPASKMVLTEQIIVQFQAKTSLKAIVKIESGYGLKRIQSFPFARNTFLYELDNPLPGLKISNGLHKSGSVNYAYSNWMRIRMKRSIPDDPLFANQWHLLNTGQGGGQSGEDVNIVSVWDTYRGSANEIIALVDDGLEIDHPDLRDNVRTDLCWDFVNNNSDTTTPVKVFIPCRGYSDLSMVNVYLFDGSSWLLGCDGQGNVQNSALGWMVEGSRVDHPELSPPAIEIRLYHFSAVQAGSSLLPDTAIAKSGGGGGGGFIETASMWKRLHNPVRNIAAEAAPTNPEPLQRMP